MLEPKNVITLTTMKDSQCNFVFFVCFVYFVVKYVWVAGVKPTLAVSDLFLNFVYEKQENYITMKT